MNKHTVRSTSKYRALIERAKEREGGGKGKEKGGPNLWTEEGHLKLDQATLKPAISIQPPADLWDYPRGP